MVLSRPRKRVWPSTEAFVPSIQSSLRRCPEAIPPVAGTCWRAHQWSPVVTGNQLRNARSGQDEFRKWETSFTLSPDGGKRFGRYTEANIGNRLAVVLDNQVINAATIQSKIDEQGRITNLSSEQEASNLAQFLKSGSLPAGIVYREERAVGPSLGADSIREGVVAGVGGLTAGSRLTLFYY